jgi:hypothetical protein
MSRKKLGWISAVTWALVANAVMLLRAGTQNANATAWRIADLISTLAPGLVHPQQFVDALELLWEASLFVGVVAAPVALAAGAALVGAFVTRYPAR